MKYIFIHGLGQNPSSWDKTLSDINIDDEIICVNLIEFLDGKDATYNNLYSAFKSYCDNFNEPLNLCGLSLGGMLALNYAFENPSKINSLILIGTQFKIPTLIMKIQNVMSIFLPEKTFSNTGFSKEKFVGLVKDMARLDFTKGLSTVSCKTLVICGSKDYPNKKASIGLSEKIKSATLTIIDGAGHELNKDKPQELASSINKFYS